MTRTGPGFRLEGGAEWHALARRMKDAERPIRLATSRALRGVARPLVTQMRDEGAAAMPRRGGLSGRIARARLSQANLGGRSARTARVELRIRSAEGYDINALERGDLRHPVYGRSPWVSQRVPVGAFMRPFHRGAPQVQAELLRRIDQALKEIGG